MLSINFDDKTALGLLLFGTIICTFSWLQRPSKSLTRVKPKPFPNSSYPAHHLACLLEDAPAKALKGQAYELATPLMTPLACTVPQFWHDFYRQNLGKSRINYWQWCNQPEVNNICPELTILLQLPPPQPGAKDVLESLATEKNLPAAGKLNQQDLQRQKHRHLAFKHWHERAIKQIGTDALKAIYQVCYRTNWDVIEQILDDNILSITEVLIDLYSPWWQVLGVDPQANASQVEKAYKTLLRSWHPDLNKHPYATEITARLNVAYEQYQAFLEASQQAQLNYSYNLWLKFKDWFS